MTLLRTYASLLGGDVVGHRIVFSPPGHSERDRSASLLFDPKAPDGFVVHSFAGDNWLPIRNYVKERLGLLSGKPVWAGLPLVEHKTCPAKHRERGLAIWEEAYDRHGTAVEIYLHGRGLTLPDEAAGDAIRFHPACPFAGGHTPAMVCLVRDIVTNRPKAIHRTALDRGTTGATLYGRGRDIEEIESAVEFNKGDCRWFVLGKAEEVRRTDERAVILNALLDAGEPMSPTDIAAATGMKSNNVRQLLLKMTKAGEVVKQGRSQYVHPNVISHDGSTPDNNDNTDNIAYLTAKGGDYG